MAGFTLYPEEFDNYPTHFKNYPNKSLFSTSNNLLKLKNDLKQEQESYNRVSKLFRPLRIILALLGRWPFQPQSSNNRVPPLGGSKAESETQSHLDTKFPTNYYTFSVNSFCWAYFILTTLFLSVVLLFSILGFCDFFLDWNLFAESSWDELEKRYFKSNLVPFVLVWSCLMHSSISSLFLIINRKKVAKFLNYWDFAVNAMRIEVPKGLKTYIWTNQVVFLAFLIVIYIAYKILYLNLIRGGAALIGILTFRPFISMFDITRDLFKIRVFGVVVILYSVYASRAFLLLFSFKSKLLRHAFKIWNGRFKSLLRNRVSCKDDESKCEKLFDDYKILLKLVQLTDQVFGAILQSYYGSQLINMCFELYYLARSGTFSESSLDIFAALLVLFQNLYIFFTVSLDAAYVNEEATKGFEILRQCGISPMDSIHKKYLISNMETIFSHKIILTGGRYFSLDRPFIVTVVGAVLTYFIIVLQMGPSLHKNIEERGSHV